MFSLTAKVEENDVLSFSNALQMDISDNKKDPLASSVASPERDPSTVTKPIQPQRIYSHQTQTIINELNNRVFGNRYRMNFQLTPIKKN